MNKKEICKMVKPVVLGLGKKMFESVLHAATFAYVSKKVSQFMDRNKDEKVRVEPTENENIQVVDSAKTGT